jgi:hypothetical protein
MDGEGEQADELAFENPQGRERALPRVFTLHHFVKA